MKRMILFLRVFPLFAGAVFAQSNIQTVATVRLTKTEAITLGQLKAEVEKMEKLAGRTLTPEERREVLEGMVNNKLVLQAAERDLKPPNNITDNKVNEQINLLKSQLAQQQNGRQPTDAELAKALGMDSMAAARAAIKDQMLMEGYLLLKVPGLKNPQVSDKEITDFYNNNKAEFAVPEIVGYSALVFGYKTDAEKQAARGRANQLAGEIKGNVNTFDAKILQYGGAQENASIAAGRGSLPRNYPGYPEEFLKVVFTLEQGKVSEVLDLPPEKRFLILKITDKYPSRTLGLNDSTGVQSPDGKTVTVRMYIQGGLAQQKRMELLPKAQEDIIAALRKEAGKDGVKIEAALINY
ncbi:MAG: peptidyl-prolyl cis-trans isomerase [Treponema sp.]|jgi:hypothetical protein|nr:peptidyl-prolyl cis-trans isomerase [Treponema sp.]